MATACNTNAKSMKLNHKTRLQLRIQSTLFIVLFIGVTGLLAWLTQQYHFKIDLTASQSNSLSGPTLRLLQSLKQPVSITAYVSPVNKIKEGMDAIFQRYQQSQPLIEYHSVNPDFVPDALREYNIQRDGEVVIEIDGRHENLQQITESSITNAIARLTRQAERWVMFVSGHGERDPYGEANFDLQLFGARLAEKGFQVETVNLLQTTDIPHNTDILVIADAASAMLPGEVNMISQYLQAGGNLLWLADVNEDNSLDTLAEQLELEFLPGVIVDPNTQILGLSRVDFALVADYPRHAITNGITALSLYPRARAMQFHGEQSDWQAVPLMVTQARSWNEVGELKGKITQGDQNGEIAGPLNLGYSLQRSLQKDDGSLHTQRVVVVGDADFLSNQYLGNGSNLDLGLNLFNWLSHDDNLISISPRSANDTQLQLSSNSQLFIALTFLLVLPLVLLASGLRIWLVRRRR
jgi:ABC-type uncharacterized transport system involved in gliding motility auxiliary subunit